ncbi:MAG: hypothetical protein OXC11_04750 [Rhodospirillales bacterium]|nr:hypothetical protein [Rhodospirillales bacterium]
MRRCRALVHCFVITLVAAPAAAMIEYGPLAREAAVEAGCVEPEIQRLGNEGAAIVYTMACSPGSAVSDGRIRCELEACQLEDGPPPAGDAETE